MNKENSQPFPFDPDGPSLYEQALNQHPELLDDALSRGREMFFPRQLFTWQTGLEGDNFMLLTSLPLTPSPFTGPNVLYGQVTQQPDLRFSVRCFVLNNGQPETFFEATAMPVMIVAQQWVMSSLLAEAERRENEGT